MKKLFATAIILVSAVSLWAQGQVVEGSCVSTADRIDFADINGFMLDRSSFPSSNVSSVESSRVNTFGLDIILTTHFLTPVLFSLPTSGSSAFVQNVTPAPEPSILSFAFLIGLCVATRRFGNKLAHSVE